MFESSKMRLAAVGLYLVASVCSGSDGPNASDTTETSGRTTATTVSRAQTLTVTPSVGLREGQSVHVVARGFTPHQSGLGVVQCADRQARTNEGDCNLGGIELVASDGAGVVTADFTVTKGPLGGNGHTCSRKQTCLISVTQLSLAPAEAASGPITFAD